MSSAPILPNPEFLAANASTVERLREHYPDASEEDLVRSIRAAKWWLKEEDHLSEADLAIRLIRDLIKATTPHVKSDQLW